MKKDARDWLKGLAIKSNNSKAIEVNNYIKHLESEVERLRYFSPYPEDNPETPEANPKEYVNSKLFGSRH